TFDVMGWTPARLVEDNELQGEGRVRRQPSGGVSEDVRIIRHHLDRDPSSHLIVSTRGTHDPGKLGYLHEGFNEGVVQFGFGEPATFDDTHRERGQQIPGSFRSFTPECDPRPSVWRKCRAGVGVGKACPENAHHLAELTLPPVPVGNLLESQALLVAQGKEILDLCDREVIPAYFNICGALMSDAALTRVARCDRLVSLVIARQRLVSVILSCDRGSPRERQGKRQGEESQPCRFLEDRGMTIWPCLASPSVCGLSYTLRSHRIPSSVEPSGGHDPPLSVLCRRDRIGSQRPSGGRQDDVRPLDTRARLGSATRRDKRLALHPSARRPTEESQSAEEVLGMRPARTVMT